MRKLESGQSGDSVAPFFGPGKENCFGALCPLLTEIRKVALTKSAWSLVRNGTCKLRILLRATPPSTE